MSTYTFKLFKILLVLVLVSLTVFLFSNQNEKAIEKLNSVARSTFRQVLNLRKENFARDPLAGASWEVLAQLWYQDQPTEIYDGKSWAQRGDVDSLKQQFSKFVKADLPMDEKFLRCNAIIKYLSETEDSKNILEFVEDNIKSIDSVGLRRDILVSIFAYSRNDMAHLTQMLCKFHDSPLQDNTLINIDKAGAVSLGASVIIQRLIGSNDYGELIKFHALMGSSGRSSLASHFNANTCLQMARSDKSKQTDFFNRLINASDFFPVEQREPYLNQILSRVAFSMPDEALKSYFSKFEKVEYSEKKSDAIKNIMYVNMRNNPVSTMNTILEYKTSNDKFLQHAVYEWSIGGSSGAKVWFEANQQRLTPRQSDIFQSSIAEAELYKNNFQNAQKQINQISDPTIKVKAEEKYAVVENKQILKEIGNSPQPLIDSIALGSSKNPDHWLAIAMNQWIAKEPENAQQWYEKNWETLSPAKAQYIAEAYAINSINQGDYDRGKQWESFVIDDKSKTRINNARNAVRKKN